MRKPFFRLFAAFALVAGAQAHAVTFSSTFVKTLGQSSADSKFAFTTAGGRIAVDEAGNAYFGTPGGSSYLQRISPQGKILWQFMHNVPGFQGTAVDEKYLYTCGSGYYGRIQLQRWLKEGGEAAPGWQYDWENSSKEINGIASPKFPTALAVDDKYLFVADSLGNEIRRFDKASGAEAPFKNRLLVVAPTDLALTPKGSLLILTESAVVEVDRDGTALKVPVVARLFGPTAIDVSRKTGNLYIAEGGSPQELVNRVRVYSPEGKMLQEIGIGGDFNGKWHPLSFAFSSGAGDITLDANDGLWINAYGHRMFFSPLLTHLNAAGQADLTLRGTLATGLTVDPNLDVYAGSNIKMSWDDKLLWTSGLIAEGPAKLFPTTLTTWMMLPAWSDGKTAIIANVHYSYFYQVNAKNGATLGKTLPAGVPNIAGVCTVGRDIFYTGKPNTILKTSVDLEAPQTFMTLPEGAVPTTGAIAVSPDQQLIYLGNGADTGCYRRNGTEVWRTKAAMGTLFKGVLFVVNPDGAGVAALDAATGKKIGTLGDKEEDGRTPFYNFTGIATASKDGTDYLFINTNARVLVYRIAIG